MNPTKTFFTSDQHFGSTGHAVKYRTEFMDSDHMDDVFIDAWNCKVPDDGHTFCIGDFSVTNSKRTGEILDKLNGRKYLVIGNHDRGLNMENKNRFEWVKPYHEQKIDFGPERYVLIMCHYAFRSWNKMHYGALNLHGHSHANLPRIPAQLDVGVDSARIFLGTWAPFSMEDIISMIGDQQAVCEDHHQPPESS